MSAKNIRFYYQDGQPLEAGQQINIGSNLYHYLTNVLRVKKNEIISIFNEVEGEWEAIVKDVQKKHLILEVCQQRKTPDNRTPLKVGVPIIRPHLFELMISMGTQLGVTHFFPIEFRYSQKFAFKPERIQKLIIEASEQSGRIDIPEMHEAMAFSEVVDAYSEQLCVFVEPRYQDHQSSQHNISLEMMIVIGPEGGFAPEEIQLLQARNVSTLSLPSPVLRTETALPAVLGYFMGGLLR